MSTLTVPLEQHITAADTEVVRALRERVLPTIKSGLHSGDAAHLQHEAARWEAMQPSPLRTVVLGYVDAERTWRRHLARLGGRG